MCEECGEWLRGTVVDDGRVGIFPRVFVSLKQPSRVARPITSPRKPLPTPPSSQSGVRTRLDRTPSSAAVIPIQNSLVPNAAAASAAGGGRVSPRDHASESDASTASSSPGAVPPLRKVGTLLMGGRRPSLSSSPPPSPRKDNTPPVVASPRKERITPQQQQVSTTSGVRSPSSSLSSTGPAPQSPQHSDPILQELVSVLHEWSALMWASYAEHNMTRYTELKDRLYTLRSWYTRILNPSLPVQVRDAIKGQVVDKIEKGKRAMKLDLVIKNKSGQVMTDINTPVGVLLRGFLELKQQKKKRDPRENSLMTNTIRRLKSRASDDSAAAAAAAAASSSTSSLPPCGLLFKLGTCVLGLGQPVLLAFQLWKKNECITDTFWVQLDAKSMPELPKLVGDMGNIRTLFRDLSVTDLLSGDVWLVCRITRFGPMSLEKKSKTECRRPVGMAVLQLGKQLFKQLSAPAEASMDIYCCPTEQQFSSMHELLISSVDRSGLVVVPKTTPLKVCIFIWIFFFFFFFCILPIALGHLASLVDDCRCRSA